MKIINNDEVLQGQFPQPNRKTESTANKEFDTILKETVAKTQTPVAGLRPTKISHSVAVVPPISLSPADTRGTIDHIENLVNLLDQYRQKLADPRVTLREMEPLIQKMAEEKENLGPVLDSLQDDEGLKPVLNQTLVAASLEIAKYYRGDYVTA